MPQKITIANFGHPVSISWLLDLALKHSKNECLISTEFLYLGARTGNRLGKITPGGVIVIFRIATPNGRYQLDFLYARSLNGMRFHNT